MYSIFYCKGFNDHDLGDGESPLRKKFNAIIEDLEENKSTNQGDIKLIRGKGGVKYFRAKLSDRDRLLFKAMKHGDKDIFVILEVILNHDYRRSKFLTDEKKIENIKIIDQNSKEVSDSTGEVKIRDAPQVCWLGNFITLSAKQEDIVENAKDLPLVVSGSAGSGKTSVALEKLRKIEEEFKKGRILYITKSENLIKRSKELYEYVYWDETANDFKIGIPDRIEFLSLHEFLEKQAEGIKGKKPVDRNKFFSWFNEICKKDRFKEYKKDGDKIFEEFTAVIAGGDLKKEEYKELGKRQAIFSEEKRDHVYGLFGEYKEFIEKDSEYYDPNLIAHKCTEEKVYDVVVIDEVQDLTESTLSSILKSLKDGSKDNFLLCGDVNQVIHPSFFSLSKLKSFLHKNAADKEPSVCFLEKNYRNSQQVIELSNRILHFKNYCFASEDKITEEEKKLFFMKSDTENEGNVDFTAEDKEQEMARKVPESINWAVLVLNDESKEDASRLFNTPLVFNIHEAKGLEFKNVILYKFMSHEAYNEVWNIAKKKTDEAKIENAIKKIRDSYHAKNVKTSRNKDKGDKSSEEYKFYMNALYVGVTRAINSVYVIGNEGKCNLLRIIKSERVSNTDIKKEESTPEEWRNMALELIDKGNIEQAKSIEEKLRQKKEEKYAKEIMNALKAKEYHEELHNSDKNKHTSSVLESDISSRSSQSSEHEGKEDDISKPQNKKGKHNKNKKKKAKKCHQVQEVKPQLSLEDSTNRKHNSKKPQNEKYKQDLNDEKESKRLEKNTKELFSALENGDLQKAKKLIKKGVNINAEDSNGYTSLHIAVVRRDMNVIKFLLKHKADINAESTKKSDTSLHLAAEYGYNDIAALLLDKGANVNAKNDEGATLLHVAAQNGHDGVVKLLLEHNVEVNVENKKGATPLHLAAEYGCNGVVALLLKHGADVNAEVQKSFTSGDTKIKKGLTPLHVAAQKGCNGVVKLLLEHEAKVDAKTDDNLTPLHLAVQDNHYGIVKLLLEHEAKVDAKTDDNLTPLHLAVQDNHYGIVQLLLKHKADINAKAEGGYTPLHLAAEVGHKDVVELLLQHKADVNAKIKEGFTPLSIATQNVHNDIVKLLHKYTKENSQPNSNLNGAFVSNHSSQAQGFNG